MSSLTVELLTGPSQVQPFHEKWNELAGERPQLRWEWLGSWADHYCREKQLMVLMVRDGEEIIGFTPWYVEQPQFSGRRICFLGSGHVCTDHLTLLIESGREDDFVHAIVEWLLKNRVDGPTRASHWTHMELIGVDSIDANIRLLIQTLVNENCDLDIRDGKPCYGIELPDSMDEYVKRRSKSGKRECRKIRSWLNEDRFEFVTPQDAGELQDLWYTFVDLHLMRRRQSGDGGCFEHVPFGEFLWDASNKLLDSGLLRLTFACSDGVPIAVQHALVSNEQWLYYQSGMDAGYGEFKPGQLVLYHTIEKSIQEGKKYFDMMRGDEEYKLRWRAEKKPTMEVRIAAPHRVAIFQQRAWQWKRAVKSWTKRSLSKSDSGACQATPNMAQSISFD